MIIGREFGCPSYAIHEFMKRPKNCHKTPVLEKYREEGRQYDFQVYLADEERFVHMRVKISAGRLDEPTTYEAAFVLDGERVRGVGYNPVARKHYYKEIIPSGWHQNIIDPNIDGNSDGNHNRHEALIDWSPVDFDDFVWKVCKLWNVDLVKERGLL